MAEKCSLKKWPPKKMVPANNKTHAEMNYLGKKPKSTEMKDF